MTYAEVADKFLECAAFAKCPPERAKATIERVRTLESLGDIRQLTALLSS